MKPSRNLLALVLVAVGLLWVFQGLGYLAGSFMTGQKLWFYIGLAAMAAGLGRFILNNRPGR